MAEDLKMQLTLTDKQAVALAHLLLRLNEGKEPEPEAFKQIPLFLELLRIGYETQILLPSNLNQEKPDNYDIMVKVFKKMEEINPNHSPSHDLVDFTIENFIDGCRNAGCIFEPETIADYFFENRKNHG